MIARSAVSAQAPLPNTVRLHRSMGLADVALFFVIAGSNLQWIATAAAAGPSSLVVWIVGAFAMFIPLTLVVIYLASRYPDEGGLYIWSKRAFGPFAGFITGWTYWTSNLPYFPALLYFTAGNALFIGPGRHETLAAAPLYFAAVSLAGLALGTLVNICGLDVAKWLNNIGAVSRWTITLVLVGVGAVSYAKFGPVIPLNAASLRPGLQLKDLIFWSVIAFAWTGPEALSLMAGEVKNARRAIPLGLAIAAPVIAAVYILGTLSVITIVKPADVNVSAGVMQAIRSVAERIGWPLLTPVAAILVVVSCLGSVGAWLGAVARIPFVAGIDHYLPTGFGRMHPRFHSPIAALIAQSTIASVFILLSQSGTTVKGAYDVLVSTTVVIALLPFVLLFASGIVLTRDDTAIAALRIPGGNATVIAAATIGIATTLLAIVLALFPADDDPNKLLAVLKVLGMTVLTVGTGVVVFMRGERRKRTARVAEPVS